MQAAHPAPERVGEDAALAEHATVVLAAQDERSGAMAHATRLKILPSEYTAGPSSTMNIAGKIRKISGNSILIGAFCARSSAFARRACASRPRGCA